MGSAVERMPSLPLRFAVPAPCSEALNQMDGARHHEAAVILGYHALANGEVRGLQTPEESFYTLDKQQFERQLDFLKCEGYCTLLPDRFLANTDKSDSDAVLITFDDGYESDSIIAAPALQKRGLHAVFFVCLEFVGRVGYMSWDQIRALQAQGMSVQSHGLLHHDLTQLAEEDAFHELRAARLCLERNLNHPVRYLALPGGFANTGVYHAAFRAGYEAVFNSAPAVANRGKILARFVVRGGMSQRNFERIVRRDRGVLVSVAVRRRVLELVKSTIGIRRYEILKQRIWQ